MTRRIGLIINPTADRGRAATLGVDLAERLKASGHQVTDLSGVTATGARDHALPSIASGLDVLVVAGGDGTVNLGVNLCAGTKTVLGIVAVGTGNDIARALKLPIRDASTAADVIAKGTVRTLDAGRLVEASGGSRWFAGVLGAGFDSVVNERANRWRWPRGRMRYNLAIARELPVFKPIPYVIEVDGVRHRTEAMLVAVGNGPSYGGGMRVCPDASFDDGLFDILVVHQVSTTEFLRVFPTVFSGKHVGHPAVQILRGRQVRLEAAGIVSYADGERFAPLPISLQNVPAALRVLVPASLT